MKLENDQLFFSPGYRTMTCFTADLLKMPNSRGAFDPLATLQILLLMEDPEEPGERKYV